MSEKITSDCQYDIRTKDENIPCYFIYVDTNGDKKPNRLTTDMNFYKDIITFYAYEDRFILWPEDVSKENDNNQSKPETPSTPSTPEQPSTPVQPETPEQPDTPTEPEKPEEPEKPNDPDEPKMERCLDKRPYDECVKFCEKNGYHSALCR